MTEITYIRLTLHIQYLTVGLLKIRKNTEYDQPCTLGVIIKHVCLFASQM